MPNQAPLLSAQGASTLVTFLNRGNVNIAASVLLGAAGFISAAGLPWVTIGGTLGDDSAQKSGIGVVSGEIFGSSDLNKHHMTLTGIFMVPLFIWIAVSGANHLPKLMTTGFRQGSRPAAAGVTILLSFISMASIHSWVSWYNLGADEMTDPVRAATDIGLWLCLLVSLATTALCIAEIWAARQQPTGGRAQTAPPSWPRP